MTVSNSTESKNNELALKRIAALEEQLEQSLKTNAALDRELQVASKTIVRRNSLLGKIENHMWKIACRLNWR